MPSTPPRPPSNHVPLPTPEVLANLTRRLATRGFRVDQAKVETVCQADARNADAIERGLSQWDTNALAQSWLTKQFGPVVALATPAPAKPAAAKPVSAPPAPAVAAPTAAAPASPATRRIGCHVYASHAAASLELSRNPDGEPALFLDAAGSAGQARQYDWANKISLMLSQKEALQLFAVLIGRVSACKGEYHGSARDKGFSLEDQGEHLFLKLTAAGQPPRALPVPPAEALLMADVCASYLLALQPQRPLADWISLLDMTLVRLARATGKVAKPE